MMVCQKKKYLTTSKYQQWIIDILNLINKKIHFSKIIWFGDLNYRVDKPLRDGIDWSTVDIMGIIREKDQLYARMTGNKVFLGYREGEIKFKPTYKYDVGTDNWDTR